MDDTELRRMQRAAKQAGLTLAEWVRQALRRAEREAGPKDPSKILAALERAVAHDHPAPAIDQMLEEIERGRAQSDSE